MGFGPSDDIDDVTPDVEDDETINDIVRELLADKPQEHSDNEEGELDDEDDLLHVKQCNNNRNQLRRDALKPSLHPKYQALSKIPDKGVDTSQWLFGHNMAERISSTTKANKMSRRMGYMGYGSQMPARGRRYSFVGYHPYVPRTQQGRDRGFLGKVWIITDRKISHW